MAIEMYLTRDVDPDTGAVDDAVELWHQEPSRDSCGRGWVWFDEGGPVHRMPVAEAMSRFGSYPEDPAVAERVEVEVIGTERGDQWHGLRAKRDEHAGQLRAALADAAQTASAALDRIAVTDPIVKAASTLVQLLRSADRALDADELHRASAALRSFVEAYEALVGARS